MIKCPHCNNTIPATNQFCQFCKNPVPTELRAVAPKPNYMHDDESLESGSGLPPEKVWKIYYGLSWSWIGISIFLVLILATIALINPDAGKTTYVIMPLIMGFATIFFGFGLLKKWETLRQIVTVICILKVLTGLVALIGFMMSIILFGVFGLIFTIMQVIDLAISCSLIWAINETERLMNLERMSYRRR